MSGSDTSRDHELQAFLYVPDTEEGWYVTSFTQLRPMLAAAKAAAHVSQRRVFIHLGFWEPSLKEITDLAASCPDGLIVSDAAAGALAEHLPVEAAAVGCIRGVVFRRAMGDWAKTVDWVEPAPVAETPEASEIARPSAEELVTPTTKAVWPTWINDLGSKGSDELAAWAASAGVVDEATYQELEAQLPRGVRHSLGVLRFILAAGDEVDASAILDSIWAFPPWLMSLRLEALPLTVRQANVFRAHGIERVRDLEALGRAGLMTLPGLGQGSMLVLGKTLVRALESGLGLPPAQDVRNFRPVEEPPEVEATTSFESVRSGFRDMASKLTDAQREVWAGRLGFGCERMTLQQLAPHLSVSRERIRQIEAQVYRVLEHHPFWKELAIRIESALDSRQSALFLKDLPEVDPWFVSDVPLEGALEIVLEEVFPQRFGVHLIDAKPAVSMLLAREWGEVRDAARDALEAGAKAGIDEVEARRLCDQLLGKRGGELRNALWAEVTSTCTWADRPGEPRRLIGLDDNVAAVVRAVLEASDEPLHYSEIQRRAELIRPGYEPGYIKNAVNQVGVLFDRGVYGLPRHCPLDGDALSEVRAAVEELMVAGDPTRQWHASELYEALIERGMAFGGRLTPYVLNFALRESPLLADLRRMVWGLSAAWQEGAASRVDLRSAVIELLKVHGRPMTTDEIRRCLVEIRGVSPTFQILPWGPLVRVGPGLWGLDGFRQP